MHERTESFAVLMEKKFGLSVAIKISRSNGRKLTLFTSTGVNLGTTTISFTTGSFRDILFGRNTGMFMCPELTPELKQVSDDYSKRYPKPLEVD